MQRSRIVFADLIQDEPKSVATLPDCPIRRRAILSRLHRSPIAETKRFASRNFVLLEHSAIVGHVIGPDSDIDRSDEICRLAFGET